MINVARCGDENGVGEFIEKLGSDGRIISINYVPRWFYDDQTFSGYWCVFFESDEVPEFLKGKEKCHE